MSASDKSSLIAGRYEILGILGEGAMGDVFKVLDYKTKNVVALKFLSETQKTSGSTIPLEGFKREFEILKNLRHPHIARIFDFGVDTVQSSEKRYYFTEELIEGDDLWRATEKLPFDVIEDLFVQVLRALEFLHTNNIYHLDLKPSNLLVIPANTPKVKVIDFGLSGFKDSQIILGTPSYTAPEIVLGMPRGAPADLYSLGVIFYKCFTRVNPFQSGEVKETWNRHLHLKVDPPSSVDKNIPEYVDIILMNLLEKKPSNRYSRAAYVIRSLNHLSGKNYPLETGETLVSYLPEEGKLIGRDDIWQELIQIFKEQFAEKAEGCRVVLLHGPSGTGKTRLLKEMRYYSQLCEVPTSDWDEEEIPSKPFVLLGDLPSPMSDETKEKLRLKLGSISKGLCVFSVTLPDDVQWFQGWIPDAATIQLDYFSIDDVNHYIGSATGLKNLPKIFVKQLYQHCDGNPRLLKEIIQKLMESGELLLLEGHLDEKALVDFSIPWERVEDILALKDMFSERWGKLNDQQKDILVFLSVLEHGACLVDMDHAVLEGLMWGKWIIKEPNGQYSLANPSFNNLIVKSLSDDVRGLWHDKIADFLENTGANAWEINYHRSFGKDLKRALSALPEYVRGCFRRERRRLAKPALDRAWSLGVKDEWWGELMLKWVHTAIEAGEKQEARDALEKLQDFTMPDSPLWEAEILIAKATLNLKEKNYSDATKSLQMVFDNYSKSLPRPIFIRAKNIEGAILMDQSRLEQAEQLFSKNFEEWLKLSDDEKRQVTNNSLAACFFLQQEYGKCWDQLQVELPYYYKLNDTVLLNRCYYLLGCSSLKLGKTVDGISYLKKCIAAASQIQETDLLLLTYNELGNLYFSQRQLDEARIHFEHALNLAQRKKNHSRVALIASNLAVVHAELGQDPQCISFLHLATRLLKNMPEMRVENWVAKGLVLLELSRYHQRHGRLGEAENFIKEAYGLAREKRAVKVILPQIKVQYEKVIGQLPPEESEPEKKAEPQDDDQLAKMNATVSRILENLQKIEATTDNLSKRITILEKGLKKPSASPKRRK